MSDTSKPVAAKTSATPVTPPAVDSASSPGVNLPGDFATQFAAAFQGEAERARLRDMDSLARARKAEDDAREKAGTTKLVAITSWTEFDGITPEGKTYVPGQEFEISLFDLQKYAGKAVARAPDPLTGGVTVSSSPPQSMT